MHKDYQSYLEAKHASMVTPEVVIDDVVRKATGLVVVSRECLMKGEANEVYRIETDSGKPLILRVSHKREEPWQKGASSFRLERAVIDEVGKAGAKVPNVLGVTEESVGDSLRGFCIEEVLPGVPLNEANLSQEEKQAVVIEAGAELTKIHSIKMESFGYLELREGALVTTGEEMKERLLNHRVNDSGGLEEIATRIGIPKGMIERALSFLDDAALRYPPTEPCLLHGDFGPKHIMVDGGKLSGVVDFEDASSGDPIRDIARWRFFFNDKFPMEWLMSGYSNKSIIGDDFEWKLRVLAVNMALDHLYYYNEEKNEQGLLFAKKRLLYLLGQ